MADSAGDVKQRNARACEACRAIKGRCIFKEQKSVCQRCEQNGSQCLVRTKARPHRVRAVAKIQSADASDRSRSQEGPPKFAINLPSVAGPDVNHDAEVLRQHHKQALGGVDYAEDLPDSSQYFKSQSSTASPASPLQNKLPSSPGIIEPRRLTLKEASQLLLSFRDKASFFPFVTVPASASVQSLSRTSPFLLLAILTTSAIPNPVLHHQLDQEWRRLLSIKVIVEGRKSLEYLQGLLIYVAWYPFHSNPKNNQAFMYMNLATSLSVDLGLDREQPIQDVSLSDILTEGLIDGYSFTKAAKRAYLGCYYLSSALALGFHKPNNFPYNDLMTLHGEALVRDEVPSDANLWSLVQLQRMDERINESNSATKPPVFDSEIMTFNFDMTVQIFQNELRNWRASTSPTVQNLSFIGLTERFLTLNIYSHELGSLRRPYRYHTHLSKIPSNSPSHPQKCLDACKRYFEYLLSMPESLFWNMTSILWAHMVQSILVLSRLTFLLASSNNWDAETTRTNIPLAMYLDCLCYRLQSLSQNKAAPYDTTTTPPDAMFIFKMVIGSVKSSYERRVANIQPGFFHVENDVAVGTARGRCPMHDPDLRVYFQSDEGSRGGSGEMTGQDWSGKASMNEGGSGSGSGSSSNIFYRDLWATMTSYWAEEF